MSLTDKERCGKSPPWKSWEVASFRHYFSVCAILLALRSSSPINKADRLRRLPRASDAKMARDLNFGVS